MQGTRGLQELGPMSGPGLLGHNTLARLTVSGSLAMEDPICQAGLKVVLHAVQVIPLLESCWKAYHTIPSLSGPDCQLYTSRPKLKGQPWFPLCHSSSYATLSRHHGLALQRKVLRTRQVLADCQTPGPAPPSPLTGLLPSTW